MGDPQICLCSRLEDGQFDSITTAEIEQLGNWVRSLKAQKQTFETSPSKFYPDKRIEDFLKQYIEPYSSPNKWKELLDSLFNSIHAAEPNDLRALIGTINRLEATDISIKILKRILCVVFRKVHPYRCSLKETAKHIAGQSAQDENDMQSLHASVVKVAKISSRWLSIFHKEPGLILLLQQQKYWEDSSQKVQELTLKKLSSTDIMQRARKYTPLMKALVHGVQNRIAFASPRQPAQTRSITSRTDTAGHSQVFADTQALRSPASSPASSVHDTFARLEGDAGQVLGVLLFLNQNEIPVWMLHQSALPQDHWNPSGEVEKVSNTEGRDPNLLQILSDKRRLDSALKELASKAIISQTLNEDGSETLSIIGDDQNLRRSLSAEQLAFWTKEALLLTCSAFPGDKYTSSNFSRFGRLCLPHFRSTFDFFESHDRDSTLEKGAHGSIVAAGIAASFFADLPWKLHVLDKIKKYATSTFLSALVATRLSCLLRMARDPDQSAQVLCSTNVVDPSDAHRGCDARTRAQIQFARISDAWNLIEASKLDEATGALVSISSDTARNRSTMEALVHFQSSLGVAKCYRFKGEFTRAIKVLAPFMASERQFPTWKQEHQNLILEMADVLCELKRPHEARLMLESHLSTPESTSANRRLRLALAEAFIGYGNLDDAMRLLLQLRDEFNLSSEVIQSPKLRLHCQLARVHHTQGSFNAAQTEWHKALIISQKYILNNGQTTAMIYESIADAAYQQKNLHLAGEMIRAGRVARGQPGEKELFWIVGLNAFWHRDIKASLSTVELATSKL